MVWRMAGGAQVALLVVTLVRRSPHAWDQCPVGVPIVLRDWC
jgi:hypothetical protein